MKQISDELYNKLEVLGILGDGSSIRQYNIGTSNYSEHTIQPWSVWIDWNLNPWDADIIKRVLRTKVGASRKEDYRKIIHICNERIRQLDIIASNKIDEVIFEEDKTK